MSTDKPCAAPGLTSYRCKSPYGWIMIGAKSASDAMQEAKRSTAAPKLEELEIWNGEKYVPVALEYRATDAPHSKPAWHGQYREHASGEWITAVSNYGKILYTSPEYAIAGAKFFASIS